jgi:hypothetical protein
MMISGGVYNLPSHEKIPDRKRRIFDFFKAWPWFAISIKATYNSSMKKTDFPKNHEANMLHNLTFSRWLLGVVMFVAVVAALIGVPRAAFAATGYWQYKGHQISPTPEEYAAVKPLPGRVYELKATGGFQAGPGSGKGSIDSFFKTDDADRVQHLATSTLTFGAQANLATLVPGQKVVFEASLVIGGNDKARAKSDAAGSARQRLPFRVGPGARPEHQGSGRRGRLQRNVDEAGRNGRL